MDQMKQCPICGEYFWTLRKTYCSARCRRKQFRLLEVKREQTAKLSQGPVLVDKPIYLTEPDLAALKVAEANILSGIFKQVILIKSWPAFTPTMDGICVQELPPDGTGVAKALFWKNYAEADRQLTELEKQQGNLPQPPTQS